MKKNKHNPYLIPYIIYGVAFVALLGVEIIFPNIALRVLCHFTFIRHALSACYAHGINGAFASLGFQALTIILSLIIMALLGALLYDRIDQKCRVQAHRGEE